MFFKIKKFLQIKGLGLILVKSRVVCVVLKAQSSHKSLLIFSFR